MSESISRAIELFKDEILVVIEDMERADALHMWNEPEGVCPEKIAQRKDAYVIAREIVKDSVQRVLDEGGQS